MTTNNQVNHADISASITPVNRAFENPGIAQFMNPFTAAGRAALDLVTQQAQIVAHMDYNLLLIATPALFLLLVIFRKTSGPADPTMAVEG